MVCWTRSSSGRSSAPTQVGLHASSVLKENGYSIVLIRAGAWSTYGATAESSRSPGGIAEYRQRPRRSWGRRNSACEATGTPPTPTLPGQAQASPGVFMDDGSHFAAGVSLFGRSDDRSARGRNSRGLLAHRYSTASDPFPARRTRILSGKASIREQAFPSVRALCLRTRVRSWPSAIPSRICLLFDRADAYVPANFSPAHVRAIRGSKYRLLRSRVKRLARGCLRSCRALLDRSRP